jgi:hypothetical protein
VLVESFPFLLAGCSLAGVEDVSSSEAGAKTRRPSAQTPFPSDRSGTALRQYFLDTPPDGLGTALLARLNGFETQGEDMAVLSVLAWGARTISESAFYEL